MKINVVCPETKRKKESVLLLLFLVCTVGDTINFEEVCELNFNEEKKIDSIISMNDIDIYYHHRVNINRGI